MKVFLKTYISRLQRRPSRSTLLRWLTASSSGRIIGAVIPKSDSELVSWVRTEFYVKRCNKKFVHGGVGEM